MANGLARTGAKGLSTRGGTAIKKQAAVKHPAKHVGKKAAKHVGKKAAKHVGKKAAKHVAKKAAAKHTPDRGDLRRLLQRSGEDELGLAFHHMQRAAALISLLEDETGGDLRLLLTHGMKLYQAASERKRDAERVTRALGLLRAAECLGMAGLYSARANYRTRVDAPSATAERLKRGGGELRRRVQALAPPNHAEGNRLFAMTLELLKRVEGAEDLHLCSEWMMAAEGICTALEAGL